MAEDDRGLPTALTTASALAAGLARGERKAVAQTLTEVERQTSRSREILSLVQGHLGRALVVGLTGPPGAGKSTLVDACVRVWRSAGRKVGIIAVDPSSPVSGGAILGDRIRMTSAVGDDGVFVRSLAARGHLGGLTPAAVRMIDVLDAAGFDIVVLETVGTGQSEIDVAEVTDVRVVVSAPGLGDEIQAMKSGLLEIADVLVVNKADREGADVLLHQLSAAVAMRTGERGPVSVLKTTALTGEGVPAVCEVIGKVGEIRLRAGGVTRRRMRARYLIARAAAELVASEIRKTAAARLDALADGVLDGSLSATEAAMRILEERRRAEPV